MSRSSHYQKLLKVVRERHAGQIRSAQSPAWHHVARVAEVLKLALTLGREADAPKIDFLVSSSLGHDLLEDTKTSKDDIVRLFGPAAWELIFGMTNEWGDASPEPYVKKVAASSEEVRLIKLADIYDNYSHAGYTLNLLGSDWANNYFLPIVQPMLKAINSTEFTFYRETAAILRGWCKLAESIFLAELQFVQMGQEPK